LASDIEVRTLRVFENKMLRIFGPKRAEVTGGWRKLHEEEHHNVYSSPSINKNDEVKDDEMGSVCSMNGGEENAYRLLVGKSEGKRQLGSQRHWLMDNIKMDVREIGWGGVDWIDLGQDKEHWRVFVNTVMNLWVS
jgi:hypothetical protein